MCLGDGIFLQDENDLKNYHQEKETQSKSFTLVVWNFFKGKKKLDLFEGSLCVCVCARVCMCACGEQELFLEKFVEDAFDRMQESHRNSITYSDLCKLLSYSSFILDYSFAISFLLLLLCLSHTETFCSQMLLLAIAYIACSAIRLGRDVCQPY